jgi:hypothetical protein
MRVLPRSLAECFALPTPLHQTKRAYPLMVCPHTLIVWYGQISNPWRSNNLKRVCHSISFGVFRLPSVPLSCFQPNHQQAPGVDRGFDLPLIVSTVLALGQMPAGLAADRGFDRFGSAHMPRQRRNQARPLLCSSTVCVAALLLALFSSGGSPHKPL